MIDSAALHKYGYFPLIIVDLYSKNLKLNHHFVTRQVRAGTPLECVTTKLKMVGLSIQAHSLLVGRGIVY